MRVIAGEARGRRIQAPPGTGTRPTADRVRQALFDILGQRCDGLAVLDLFAGSGALGIEALSRGARSCVFVESERRVLSFLSANLERLGMTERARVVHGDALTVDLAAMGPFDLILADPPYHAGAGPILARLAAAPALLLPGARIVLEHSRREGLPPCSGDLVRRDERRFGDSMLTFFIRDEDSP